MNDTLITQEAAEILGYHPDYLRALLRTGVIEGRRFSRVWMIDRQEVDRVKVLQGPGGRLPEEPKQ